MNQKTIRRMAVGFLAALIAPIALGCSRPSASAPAPSESAQQSPSPIAPSESAQQDPSPAAPASPAANSTTPKGNVADALVRVKMLNGAVTLLAGQDPENPLLAINLRSTKVTDDDLALLARVTELGSLDLDRTGITDVGVAHLRGLPELRKLSLANTKVTRLCMVHLLECPRLAQLDVSNTDFPADFKWDSAGFALNEPAAPAAKGKWILPKYYDELDLTDEQKDKVTRIAESCNPEINELRRKIDAMKGLPALGRQVTTMSLMLMKLINGRQKKLEDVLTEEQRAKYRELSSGKSAPPPKQFATLPKGKPASTDNTFAGSWDTTLGRMTLTQDGRKVKGRFFYITKGIKERDRCELEGQVEKTKLTFRYDVVDDPNGDTWSGGKGEGWFELAADGQSFKGQCRRPRFEEWRVCEGKRVANSASSKTLPPPAPPATLPGLKILAPEDTVDVKSTPAPAGAVVLFDGESLDNWCKGDLKTAAHWTLVDGGAMQVETGGNLFTKKTFGGAFKLHVEFRVPYEPQLSGQKRGNSGIYLQGRYEVQVLDSYGLKSKAIDCGAIYEVAAPAKNVCKAPTTWQSFDIEFHSPKFANGSKIEPARVTVHHNGVKIHDNVKIPVDNTRAGAGGDPSQPGPIMLQDHGNPVQFRNIWLVPSKD